MWCALQNGEIVASGLSAEFAAGYLEDDANVFTLDWEWNDTLTSATAEHNGVTYEIVKEQV